MLKREGKKLKQYSKQWLTAWNIFVMFWISIYLIADIYYNQALNSLTIVNSLVISIIAAIIPYFAKSFFETKEEHSMNLKVDQLHKVDEILHGTEQTDTEHSEDVASG